MSNYGLSARINPEDLSTSKTISTLVTKLYIPIPEAEENQRYLEKSMLKDNIETTTHRLNALLEYKKNNGFLQRLINYVLNGFKPYQPNIQLEKSPETKLLESIVNIQDAVRKGCSYFEELPTIVEKMHQDLTIYSQKEEDLKDKITQLEEILGQAPGIYHYLIDSLSTYESLNAQQQEELEKRFKEYTKVDEIPPLTNQDIRNILVQELSPQKDSIANKETDIKTKIELHKDELDLVEEGRKTIIDQASKLSEDWRPGLIKLYKLRERYDYLKRFTQSARLLIGINELRLESINLISEFEEAVSYANERITDLRTRAQVQEDLELEFKT